MSAVTASPDITGRQAFSRLTRTLPRATASVGVLAAAATTAGAAVLRAAGDPLAAHGKIPLAGFAQLTFIAAVIGGVLLAVLIRRSSAPRQRFVRIAAGLTALSCVAPRRSRTRPQARSPLLVCTFSQRRSLSLCSHDSLTDRSVRYNEEQPRCRNT